MNLLSCADTVAHKPLRPKKQRAAKDRPAANPLSVATNVHMPQADSSLLPFDAEAALARVQGDRGLLQNMVGLFAAQWNKQWAEIARAGRNRDGAALEMSAHQLMRSVDSFDANAVGRVAKELEACGRTGDFHNVDKTCARLRTEIDRLVNALKEFTTDAVA